MVFFFDLMKIYLKWYYGYMNMWDELLLIWLLNWIEKQHAPELVYIESWDTDFLSKRLKKCEAFLDIANDKLSCVWKHEKLYRRWTYKIFWWWEVITDARAVPWNWWNYFLWFFMDVVGKNYSILWWIWTPKKAWTDLLYKFLLWRAKQVVVRDETSYSIASQHNKNSVLYHDFCYDFLDSIEPVNPWYSPYIIINVNKYLWNNEIADIIEKTIEEHKWKDVYFLPAAWWSDDLLYENILQIFSWTKLLDRRTMSAPDIVWVLAYADHVCAARLHVLLISQWAGVSFTPFVYQEKIEKCILQWIQRK